MSLYIPPEQKEKARLAYQQAVEKHALNRRDFMKGMLAAGATVPIAAAAYFGYEKLHGNPVKAGLIGGGDEGGVLIGEHNPEYLEFVAVADIRPSNMKRIFDGDPKAAVRKGFKKIYGQQADKKIRQYTRYQDLLADKEIEAVVIALPLHLHAPVAIEAMKAGKHVLCEKLMAWNISQCKDMIKTAEETDRILSIGHQRHYSLLYAQAVEVLQAGELGDVKHIRALWHRNNSWPQLDKDGKPARDEKGNIILRDGWRPAIPAEDRKALEDKLKEYGYKSMEELVRWRLYNRTGGGLMAELGSHQLDACSIFLGKVKPLAVSGVGGKYFYNDDREVEDHVFTTFEFPGPRYWKDRSKGIIGDKNDVVVVTYSSINTNSFEPYGECVMGSRGTMVVEQERDVLLVPERNPGAAAAAKPTTTTVATATPGKPVMDSSDSTGALAPAKAKAGGAAGPEAPPSKGYREEMEHFAYCIRRWNEGMKSDRQLPRCHGTVAMADAIIALTSNLAMRKHQRIEFKPEWFDPKASAVPDAEMKPEIV